MEFKIAETEKEFDAARNLFREYAKSLNFELCFQNFDHELTVLPQEYGLPNGRLWLVYVGDAAVGCIAIRKLQENICEMKRLYVQPDFRNLKLGVQLINLALDGAKNLGYQKMRLDSAPIQHHAQTIYRKMGFYDIESYNNNPIAGVVFLEKILQ